MLTNWMQNEHTTYLQLLMTHSVGRRPRDQPLRIYPDRPVRHHRGCFRQLLHLKICSTHHKDLSYKSLSFGYSPRSRCAAVFTPASPPAVNTEAIISTYVRPQPVAAPPRGSGAWFTAQARLEQPFPSVRRRGPHHAISSAAGVSGRENAGF